MKLILATLLLVVAVNAWDQEKYILKKWTMHKAFEGCFGKENVKMYMVKKKQAFAKCSKIDSPMLELPMFQSPYKTVGSLVHSAYSTKSHGSGMDHHHHAHAHEEQDEKFDSAMLKYFIEEAVKDVMNNDDDDDHHDHHDSYKRNHYKKRPYGRYQRDADDDKKEMLDIGDRLNTKLQELQQQMSDQINNYTCVLKECGVLDSENKFNTVENMVSQMSKMEFPDEWLQENIERDVTICHKVAVAIPDEILNECIFGPELARVKCYKKCLKMRKLKTCMNYDIKQQLEENFAPLSQLVEQTEMEEKNLLPLVYKLLHGEDNHKMT